MREGGGGLPVAERNSSAEQATNEFKYTTQ